MSKNLEFEVYFEMINNELDAAIAKATVKFVNMTPIRNDEIFRDAEIRWKKALLTVLGQQLGSAEADLVECEPELNKTIEEERNNNIRDGYSEYGSKWR